MVATSYDFPTKPIRRTYDQDGRKAGKRAKAGEPDFDRLFTAMRSSRRMLEFYRRQRMEAVRQYVGGHYSEGGSDLNVPVNLIARFVQIVSRSLVPKCPRVMYSTHARASQPAVSAMQEWVNKRLPEMQFDRKLQRWVVDAMFCVGIAKVALGTPADAARGNYSERAGVPFIDTVDLDDFCFDAGCRDLNQAGWVAHRYRIPLEVAENLKDFDAKARKELSAAEPSYDGQTNQDGDERIDAVGRGWNMGTAERDFEPMVDLWEVYVSRTKRVYTFASDAGGVPCEYSRPLKAQEWLGPPCGPYHFLAYGVVPGNAMPKCPIGDLIDTHCMVNELYRKLFRQALRQKTVVPVRGGQLDDGGALLQAGDGEMFRAENADNIKEVSYGGPNQVNANFAVHLGDVNNKLAGNLDVLSGAGPQSRTATQDKLLSENASAGISDMQETTIAGAASLLNALSWYWWYHPQEEMKTSRTLPGLPDIGIERTLLPAQSEKPGLKRTGRFEDLMVKVDPYSLTFRTPSQRLQGLMSLYEKFAPAMPLLAKQGIQMDLQFLVKKAGEYMDEPDVAGLFTVADPVDLGGSGGDGGGIPKPSETTRNYNRQSQGQDTEASRYAEMANAGLSEASEQQG